jgi:hypothetical protein
VTLWDTQKRTDWSVVVQSSHNCLNYLGSTRNCECSNETSNFFKQDELLCEGLAPLVIPRLGAQSASPKKTGRSLECDVQTSERLPAAPSVWLRKNYLNLLTKRLYVFEVAASRGQITKLCRPAPSNSLSGRPTKARASSRPLK